MTGVKPGKTVNYLLSDLSSNVLFYLRIVLQKLAEGLSTGKERYVLKRFVSSYIQFDGVSLDFLTNCFRDYCRSFG